MAMPTMAAYSASKFVLEGAREAIWYEVRPGDIRVTLVQLGFVDSNGFQNVRYAAESEGPHLGSVGRPSGLELPRLVWRRTLLP